MTERFVPCHCLHIYFVRSVYFVFWFLPFLLVSQLTISSIRYSCWNKFFHILTCPHQWIWLTRFGFYHCLPYNLSVRVVFLYVLVYSCLPFLLSLVALRKGQEEGYTGRFYWMLFISDVPWFKTFLEIIQSWRTCLSCLNLL